MDDGSLNSGQEPPHKNDGGASQIGTEPDNRYYEVEEIIAGPKKRREHLFKVCYKVRWKGYGPEADTWQPIADLSNVPEMIEEFKIKKANEAKEKRKQNPKSKKGLDTSESISRGREQASTPLSDLDSDVEQGLYDPEYGTVKDKFWKDLELGRTQNYIQLFSGDMYSKVKGCRRAAHAEAVANIQKQQHLSKTQPSPGSSVETFPSKRSEKLGRLRGIASRKRGTSERRRGLSRSTSSQSSKSFQSLPSTPSSPKLSPVCRPRKRSSDPFNAQGYRSAKRSRRSREIKSANRSPDSKRLSVSSVTSETVGIVTLSSPVTPPAMQNPGTMSMLSMKTPDCTISSQYLPESDVIKRKIELQDDEMDEVFPSSSEGSKMVVSSETMLIVTTESQRLDTVADSVSSGEMEKLKKGGATDAKFLLTPSSINLDDGASGDSITSGPVLETVGGTSGGSVPDSSEVNLSSALKLSALDAQSEASGAVETEHSHECLWNGACNRSDCKSNRRRNMKKGQGSAENEKKEGESESSEVTSENTSSVNQSTSERGEDDSERNDETPSKSSELASERGSSSGEKHSCGRSGGSSIDFAQDSGHHRGPSQSSSSSERRRGSGKGIGANSSSHSSGLSRRSLFSASHGDSSDSSFDEGSNNACGPLSRDAVSDSFGRMEALAQSMHRDTLSSSTAPSRYVATTSGGRKGGETERPGLFSDNNSAFKFSRQDSGFSGGSITPGDLPGQFTLPSPTGSINLSSPGKENFGSTDTKVSGSQGSSLFTRLQGSLEMDIQDTHSDTLTSTTQSLSGQSRLYSDLPESRGSRKRANEIPQPLEKIPSPNSRESDLHRRISTLACDDLEDFPEQGEERYGHKDVGFVTNADLLQAVTLDKAEVVKRAIKQSGRSDQRLDFEQPDNNGTTLLMRAVQKGNIAEVEMLLEHGVNVNAQQINGMTALMMAAEQNSLCLVALLLKHGGNSSLYTIHGDQAETALMKAIKRQHHSVVSLMLRVGVNIAAPTCTSMSALELAMERRNPQIEGIVQAHYQRLEQAFRSRVLATLEGTAELLEPLFALQCFPLRESGEFVVKFNSNLREVARGEGFLLFIAHTKITDKGVRCRFHGGCPIASVSLNGVVQSPLTKEVNFVTSCHPIIQGCNTLVISKLADYTSKAKLVVQAFGAKLYHDNS